MQIVAIALLSLLAVFLNTFELICSEPTTLEDLFPGYSGVMPPVEDFWFGGQLRYFDTFDGKPMKPFRTVIFYKRDHVIFGWNSAGTLIKSPCRLFLHLEDISIVYDMNEETWVTLPRDLSRKLGATRRLDILVARDEVAAAHVTTSKNPVYKEAHLKACRQANDQVDIIEDEQLDFLYRNETTVEIMIRIIKEKYSEAYDRAFTLHLHQHGEYHINGHRGRHS